MSPVAAWRSIPRRIRKSVADLPARELARRGGSEGWSIREYVHHLVEANLVASNIVLAALGRPGCVYDWSWVMPDARWMKRLGYGEAPIEPAIQLLEALGTHVAAVLRAAPDPLGRHVRLLDAPGAGLRRRTIRQVLEDEVEHARHHLRDLADTRKAGVTDRGAGKRQGG